MKKLILTILSVLCLLSVKAQKIQVESGCIFMATNYVDSTLKAIDTAYTTVNNVAYREIHYLFTDLNKRPKQAHIKYYYNGNNWIFYQFRIEDFADQWHPIGLSFRGNSTTPTAKKDGIIEFY